MSDLLSRACTVFAGSKQIARGSLIDVALAIKSADVGEQDGSVLTFDDATGAVIDLDLRGSTAEIVERLTDRGRQEAAAAEGQSRSGPDVPSRGRGRPKLGVVAREITLLPRHWDWLATQPGGASQILRRLVDQARRADGGQSRAKADRERAYRFMAALAGNLSGFEEATRALFAGDATGFAQRMATWPPDVKKHALALASGAFSNDQEKKDDQSR
jgi:uncharacterized protein